MEVSGTFSILAISSDSNLMGVAVASGSTYVGDRVPYVRPGVGVIATQAYTNVTYGVNGLELLMNGLKPQEALNTLLGADPEKNLRQVAIMDFKREKAVFTGADAPKYHGEVIGDDYIVIGNLLSGKEIISSMAEEFESSDGGALAWKMMRALKAGSESGGDKRGEKSAAVVVIGTEKVEVEIKIGVHENPVEELFRKLKSTATT